MSYADYDFYSGTYYGDVLTQENAVRWLESACDELDTLTFGRLDAAFPSVQSHAVKVKKAVCAVADALYRIDVEQKAASAQKAEDGRYHGAVASISSGRESISYQESGGTQYAAAAANLAERQKLICSIAAKYLAGVPDAYGVNLLYAGR